MTSVNNYYPHALLIAIIILLQWHGISFWYSAVGVSGILFSVVVEAAALYLWVNRIAWLVAILCSFVVIVGPLYDVGYPVIQKINTSENNKKLASSYEIESKINAVFAKKDTTKNLTRLRNAEKAREDLHQSLEKYRKHISTSHVINWALYLQVIIQALGLILVQWVQIIVMRRLLPAAQQIDPIKSIIVDIAGGKFNDNPGIENIQDTLGVTRNQVRDAFRWLIDHGYMVVNDKKIKLVKTEKIDFNDIVLSPPSTR